MAKCNLRLLACAAALGLVAPAVQAAQVSATMSVSATVVGACVISTAPLTFPAYNGSAEVTAATTLSVTCSNGQTYRVFSPTTPRRMVGPAGAVLDYGLFTNVGRTTGHSAQAPGSRRASIFSEVSPRARRSPRAAIRRSSPSLSISEGLLFRQGSAVSTGE